MRTRERRRASEFGLGSLIRKVQPCWTEARGGEHMRHSHGVVVLSYDLYLFPYAVNSLQAHSVAVFITYAAISYMCFTIRPSYAFVLINTESQAFLSILFPDVYCRYHVAVNALFRTLRQAQRSARVRSFSIERHQFQEQVLLLCV